MGDTGKVLGSVMDPIFGTGYLTGQDDDSDFAQFVTYFSATGDITSSMTDNFQHILAGDTSSDNWNWGLQNTNLGKWGMGDSGSKDWQDYYDKLDKSKADAEDKLRMITDPPSTSPYNSNKDTPSKDPDMTNDGNRSKKKIKPPKDDDSGSILTGE